MNRRKSREAAMKLLYQMTVNKEELNDVIASLKENSEDKDSNLDNNEGVRAEKDAGIININEVDLAYVTNLLKAISENIEVLDLEIEKYLKNWKINRLNKVDLTILRIGTYELMFSDDIPGAVSINEAIEMSKVYSDEKSSSFINGVLDTMLKNLKK